MSNARNLAANLPLTGATGNRNIIINGAMNVSQRHEASSVTVAAGDHYIVDRFKIQDYSGATFSSQQTFDGPAGFTYSSKITVTGTDTDLGTTQYQRVLQAVEGSNVRHLNWGTANAQTVTLSFYVKSSLTGTFSVFVFNEAANRSFISTYTISAANTWEKKTVKITGDTTGSWSVNNGVGMYIGWSLGTGTTFQTSTLNAWDGSFKMAGTSQVNFTGTNGATWQVTGVQLELGSKATQFENEDYQLTLDKCMRYYEILQTHYACHYGSGHSIANLIYRVPKRATPSMSFISNGAGATHGTMNYLGNYIYWANTQAANSASIVADVDF